MSVEPAELAQPFAQFFHILFQIGWVIGHILIAGLGVFTPASFRISSQCAQLPNAVAKWLITSTVSGFIIFMPPKLMNP